MHALDLPLTALRELLDARLVSSAELASACIARTQARPDLNAWVDFQPQALMAAAQQMDVRLAAGERLPLLGIPIALKDNIQATGFTCAAGTKALAGYRPATDAALVATLKAAGALIAGKLGMHELAMGVTNNNAVTGAVKNPWNPACIPGGSSGGSGAAVGARLVPASIGTDTGGSVRIPAALCGVTGFRPTTGRWPGVGIVPISRTRDTAGPLAHTVTDCALLDAIVTGQTHTALETVQPQALRLGIPRLPFWQDLDSGVQALAEQTLERLTQAGITLVEFDLPDVLDLNARAGFPIALYEFTRDMRTCLQASPVTLETLLAEVGSPDVQAVLADMRAGQFMPQAAYEQALQARARLQQVYTQAFAHHHVDALLAPTTPRPAARIGEDTTVVLNGKQMPTFPTFIRQTDPGSVAALPGVSIPIGLVDGLPVGLALDGPMQSDRRLLTIAHTLQNLLPAPPRLSVPA